jgi:shikimate dehydrogenase
VTAERGVLRLGVIGYPIRHSVSPAFQQAAIDALGIPARYERYEVAPPDLPAFVQGLRAGAWLGVNVTIPHKQAVIPLLDGTEGLGGRIGSVNTIGKTGGSLWGRTTDNEGFRIALESSGYDFAGTDIVVLGTGGTARTVVATVMDLRVDRVTIVGRTHQRAYELAEDLRRRGLSRPEIRVNTQAWSGYNLSIILEYANLLINTTPIGMIGGGSEGENPVPPNALHDGLTVFDAVYNPVWTPLLIAARAAGARTVSGLDMLVYQGAASFTLWTGQDAPIEVMKTAARAALEGEA